MTSSSTSSSRVRSPPDSARIDTTRPFSELDLLVRPAQQEEKEERDEQEGEHPPIVVIPMRRSQMILQEIEEVLGGDDAQRRQRSRTSIGTRDAIVIALFTAFCTVLIVHPLIKFLIEFIYMIKALQIRIRTLTICVFSLIARSACYCLGRAFKRPVSWLWHKLTRVFGMIGGWFGRLGNNGVEDVDFEMQAVEERGE